MPKGPHSSPLWTAACGISRRLFTTSQAQALWLEQWGAI
jgi:hypothetical protein